MKRSKLLKIFFTYCLIFLFFTLFFILSFHSPILKNQKVLFYRGLELLILSTFLTAIFGFFVSKWNQTSQETLISALITILSLNLSFFVICPVTFDRSVTMFLLNKTHQNCFSEKELEQFFIEEYTIKDQAVKRRIFEQSVIDTLNNQNNCFKLTTTGEKILDFSETVKKIYSIK